MSLVTKLALAIIKKKIDAIVKKPYFKLLANNITPSILEGFSLKKIKSNLKANALFFYSLIREKSDVQKVNAVNGDKNMSNTILLVAKNKEDCHFQYNRRESKRGNIYFQHIQSEKNIADRYSFNNDSSKGSDSIDSNADLEEVLKSHCNCCQNKTLTAIISFCMIAYI